MQFDNIRRVFSKASISIFKDRLAITYDYKPNDFFQQCIDGEEFQTFTELMRNVHTMKVLPGLEEKTQMHFYVNESFDTPNICIFQPLDRDLTYEEIEEKMIRKAIDDGVTEEQIKENIKVINDYVHDWKDENELYKQLGELFQHVHEQNKSKETINLQSYNNYEMFKNVATKLMPYVKQFEIFAPDMEVPGTVEATIADDRGIVISGKYKDALMNLIEASSEVDFYGEPSFKEVAMTFYS